MARDCDALAFSIHVFSGQDEDVREAADEKLGVSRDAELGRRYGQRAIALMEEGCRRGYPRVCIDAAGLLTGDRMNRTDIRDPERGRELYRRACELGDEWSCDKANGR